MKRSKFRFSMIGIPVGTMIKSFINSYVTVVSDNRIEYEGAEYSLSGFVNKYKLTKKGEKTHYNGTMYFFFKGKSLYELRIEKESRDIYILD